MGKTQWCHENRGMDCPFGVGSMGKGSTEERMLKLEGETVHQQSGAGRAFLTEGTACAKAQRWTDLWATQLAGLSSLPAPDHDLRRLSV